MTYEFTARSRKAAKLAAFLVRFWHGDSATLAARMDDEQWNRVATLAGVNRPSRETQKIAIRLCARLSGQRPECQHKRRT